MLMNPAGWKFKLRPQTDNQKAIRAMLNRRKPVGRSL